MAISQALAIEIKCGETRTGQISSTAEELVFELTLQKPSYVEVDTCNGTDFDTMLDMYDGVGFLLAVTDDNGCGDTNGGSKLFISLHANETFSVVVSGVGGSNGTFQLQVTCPEIQCTEVPLAIASIPVSGLAFDIRATSRMLFHNFQIIPAHNFSSDVISIYGHDGPLTDADNWTLLEKAHIYNGEAGVPLSLDVALNFKVEGLQNRRIRLSLNTSMMLVSSGAPNFEYDPTSDGGIGYLFRVYPEDGLRFAGLICWSFNEFYVPLPTSPPSPVPVALPSPMPSLLPVPSSVVPTPVPTLPNPDAFGSSLGSIHHPATLLDSSTLIGICTAVSILVLCSGFALYRYRMNWKSAIRAAFRAWVADEMPGKPLKLRSESGSFSKGEFGAKELSTSDIEASMKSSERIEISASFASTSKSGCEVSKADEAEVGQPGALKEDNKFSFYRDVKLIADKVTRSAAPDYDDEETAPGDERAPAVVANADLLTETETPGKRRDSLSGLPEVALAKSEKQSRKGLKLSRPRDGKDAESRDHKDASSSDHEAASDSESIDAPGANHADELKHDSEPPQSDSEPGASADLSPGADRTVSDDTRHALKHDPGGGDTNPGAADTDSGDADTDVDVEDRSSVDTESEFDDFSSADDDSDVDETNFSVIHIDGVNVNWSDFEFEDRQGGDSTTEEEHSDASDSSDDDAEFIDESGQREGPDGKSLSCKQCGKSFKRKDHLENHQTEVHEKKKAFKCDYAGCDKMFSRKSNMRSHIRNVHEGRRLFACEHCGMKLKTSGNLKRHVESAHTTSFKCSLCKNCRFATKDKLEEHWKQEHPDKEFKYRTAAHTFRCFKCKKPLTSQKDLVVHEEACDGTRKRTTKPKGKRGRPRNQATQKKRDLTVKLAGSYAAPSLPPQARTIGDALFRADSSKENGASRSASSEMFAHANLMLQSVHAAVANPHQQFTPHVDATAAPVPVHPQVSPSSGLHFQHSSMNVAGQQHTFDAHAPRDTMPRDLSHQQQLRAIDEHRRLSIAHSLASSSSRSPPVPFRSGIPIITDPAASNRRDAPSPASSSRSPGHDTESDVEMVSDCDRNMYSPGMPQAQNNVPTPFVNAGQFSSLQRPPSLRILPDSQVQRARVVSSSSSVSPIGPAYSLAQSDPNATPSARGSGGGASPELMNSVAYAHPRYVSSASSSISPEMPRVQRIVGADPNAQGYSAGPVLQPTPPVHDTQSGVANGSLPLARAQQLQGNEQASSYVQASNSAASSASQDSRTLNPSLRGNNSFPQVSPVLNAHRDTTQSQFGQDDPRIAALVQYLKDNIDPADAESMTRAARHSPTHQAAPGTSSTGRGGADALRDNAPLFRMILERVLDSGGSNPSSHPSSPAFVHDQAPQQLRSASSLQALPSTLHDQPGSDTRQLQDFLVSQAHQRLPSVPAQLTGDQLDAVIRQYVHHTQDSRQTQQPSISQGFSETDIAKHLLGHAQPSGQVGAAPHALPQPLSSAMSVGAQPGSGSSLEHSSLPQLTTTASPEQKTAAAQVFGQQTAAPPQTSGRDAEADLLAALSSLPPKVFNELVRKHVPDSQRDGSFVSHGQPGASTPLRSSSPMGNAHAQHHQMARANQPCQSDVTQRPPQASFGGSSTHDAHIASSSGAQVYFQESGALSSPNSTFGSSQQKIGDMPQYMSQGASSAAVALNVHVSSGSHVSSQPGASINATATTMAPSQGSFQPGSTNATVFSEPNALYTGPDQPGAPSTGSEFLQQQPGMQVWNNSSTNAFRASSSNASLQPANVQSQLAVSSNAPIPSCDAVSQPGSASSAASLHLGQHIAATASSMPSSLRNDPVLSTSSLDTSCFTSEIQTGDSSSMPVDTSVGTQLATDLQTASLYGEARQLTSPSASFSSPHPRLDLDLDLQDQLSLGASVLDPTSMMSTDGGGLSTDTQRSDSAGFVAPSIGQFPSADELVDQFM